MVTIVKRENYKIFLIVSLYTFFAWILLYPGFYSDDSLSVIDELKNHVFVGGQGLFWNVYVYITSLFTYSFPLTILISSLTLNLSIVFLCVDFFPKTSKAWIYFIILIPSVWGFGNTLWHDVTFTAGFILMFKVLINLPSKEEKLGIKDTAIILVAILLLLTRLNGVLIVIALILILIFKLKLISKNYLAFSSMVFTLLLSVIPGLIVEDKRIEWQLDSNYFIRADLACSASIFDTNFLDFSRIGGMENWKSKSACQWFNTYDITREDEIFYQKEIRKVFLRSAMKSPETFLYIHYLRNGYLVNPVRALKSPAPFLHTLDSRKLEDGKKSLLVNYAKKPIEFTNFIRGVSGNVPFWMIFLILFILRLKNKRHLLLLIGLFVCSLFIVAPHPDTRFAMPLLLLGYISAIILFSTRNLTKSPLYLQSDSFRE